MKIRTLLLPITLLTAIFTTAAVFAEGDHPMTEGVVKKVNTSTGKITIKHGPIVNLDMPPMSMVFTVQDAAMLEGFAKGDNVKFYVIDKDGKMVIEELESAN
ncbi:copper-binding protein [Granulosicoccus antarcticus]|uniref:Cation efflux system protein CusF n=1 Tax=Granulosicoccus antarcticus IMCC3135 TaxID=1192854 RepID=A0A2Z2NQU3_9GAMM|nr:copper-binding protein [Granulosicoccus antarcticus]ASJ73713.1 Cation efflux system protein CusF [Granulosicoccus antarcticus IMCC3135]